MIIVDEAHFLKNSQVVYHSFKNVLVKKNSDSVTYLDKDKEVATSFRNPNACKAQ